MALPIDSTNPGLISPATEVFPPALPGVGVQRFPTPENFQGLTFAAPFTGAIARALPIPEGVIVENQALKPAPFGLGTATPFFRNVDVEAQNLTNPFGLLDFIVTASAGNFATNKPEGSDSEFAPVFTITSVVNADTGLPLGTGFNVNTISNATFATPTGPLVVTTGTPHGYPSNLTVGISGVVGIPELAGNFIITVTGASTFTVLPNLVAFPAGWSGAYASGGTITPEFPNPDVLPRLRIYVDPPELTSFGLTLQGRELQFDDIAKKVSNATAATPIVITTDAPHGYTSGTAVDIEGVVGVPEANVEGNTIEVLSPTTFALVGTTGTGAYVSGGTVTTSNDGIALIIAFFTAAYIVIEPDPDFMNAPAPGEMVLIDVNREGSEVVNLEVAPTLNVFVQGTPQTPPEVAAPNVPFQGTFTPGGPLEPFVGGGRNVPKVLGTFNIANQAYGQGLPVNVFPS